MLVLRGLAVCSCTTMVLFNLKAANPPMMIPVRFNVLFLVINAVQIVRILRERQDICLEPHEQRLYDVTFEKQHLTKRQVRKLLQVGTLEQVAPGEDLPCHVGDRGCEEEGAASLDIIVEGEAEVVVKEGNAHVALLGSGEFIGEMGFLLEDCETKHTHVLATQPTSFVRWERAKLREFFVKEPAIHHALCEIWNRQLVERLRHMDETPCTPCPQAAEENVQLILQEARKMDSLDSSTDRAHPQLVAEGWFNEHLQEKKEWYVAAGVTVAAVAGMLLSRPK